MSNRICILRKTWIVSILLILLFLFIIDVKPVHAVSVIVNTTSDDEDVDDSYCSLREAIQAIKNNDGDYYGCHGGNTSSAITFSVNGAFTVESMLPIFNTPIQIIGAGPNQTIIQAADCDPTQETCTNDHLLFWVNSPSGDLTLNNLSLRYVKNVSDGNGGAIFNSGILTILNSKITNNRGERGAVIQNYGGTITITDSTFSGNIADSRAGVIHNDLSGTIAISNSTFSGNTASEGSAYWDGGGVIFNETSGGNITIETSTFSGNNGRFGGAIENFSSLEITNSTFSGNSASMSGGAIYSNTSLTLTNCTFSENSSGFGGAAIDVYSTGTLNYTNTIIANSILGEDGSECDNNGGTIGTHSYNLVEDGSCDANITGDPSLGSLGNNGGPTQTHPLLSDSIAIDAGPATCPAVPTDQRGITRPQGEGCDIGAYEWQPTTPTFLPLIMK